jgi:hypothetical protein
MIIPAFIKGFREKGVLYSQKEVLDIITDYCPVFAKSQNENHNVFDWEKYKPDCILSREELEIAIEWLHYYCLENFEIVV